MEPVTSTTIVHEEPVLVLRISTVFSEMWNSALWRNDCCERKTMSSLYLTVLIVHTIYVPIDVHCTSADRRVCLY